MSEVQGHQTVPAYLCKSRRQVQWQRLDGSLQPERMYDQPRIMVVESDVADNQPDTANFWAKDCCALFGRFSPCSELLFEDANQVGKRVLVRDEI